MTAEHQPDKRAPPSPLETADASGPLAEAPTALVVDPGAFAAWASLADGDLQHHLRFHEAYLGHYDSLHDYVVIAVEQRQWDQQLDAVVPDYMRPYVDVDIDALAHDLEASGDVRVVDTGRGSIWVFDARVE